MALAAWPGEALAPASSHRTLVGIALEATSSMMVEHLSWPSDPLLWHASLHHKLPLC